MSPVKRFLAGSMVGGALSALFFLSAPSDAWAFEITIGCSNNICCTFDSETGQIFSCVRITPPTNISA